MQKAVLSILVLLFAVGAAAATPAVPNTPAGHTFNAWLTAFNSGDPRKYSVFERTYGMQKRKMQPAQYSQMYGVTGGFDLEKIETSTPTSLTALAKQRGDDNFVRIVMNVASTPPYRLTGGEIQMVPRPAWFVLPHLAQAQLVQQLQARAAQQSATGAFSGAVLVAKNGKPVFERAYGLADRSRNIPNTVDTRFRIGSMNKMFTATAIMQLVQSGKIDLDAPFGTYIKDYPNKTVSSSVTIRQLLTHTGGTGDIFGPEFDKNRLKLRTLQDYITLYGSRPLRFKPGSKFDYSNYGYIILGVVIERVSGQSYYDYVRDRIYTPAGMTSTGSEPEDAAVPNRSIGYTANPAGRLQPNTDTLPYRGTSAGGGYSTVGDLVRFAAALEAHMLLNAKYTDMMTTGKVAMAPGMKYGFGFGDRVLNGTRCFGHNGGAPGMNGDLEICPSSGYVIAALSNLDPPAAGRLAEFVANRLPLNR